MTVTNVYDTTAKPNNAKFTNTYSVQDLTIKKVVNDDMNEGGSFNFKIMIPVTGGAVNLKANETIHAEIWEGEGDDAKKVGDNDIDITIKGANASADVDENGTSFSLSNGQYLKIPGAPVGMLYIVKETDANTNGYVTKWSYTAEGDFISEVTKEDQTAEVCEGEINNGSNSVVFTNTRTVSTPAGVTLDVLPYAVVVVIALACVALLFLKKRKNAR
jgi:hypothetical protein